MKKLKLKKAEKIVFCLLATLLIFVLTSVSNEDNSIKVTNVQSGIYDVTDVNNAILAVEGYFDDHFEGCLLKSIGYVGDKEMKSDIYKDWTEQYGSDLIILDSSILVTEDVDPSLGLDPNSIYKDWKWILSRYKSDSWTVQTCGYPKAETEEVKDNGDESKVLAISDVDR